MNDTEYAETVAHIFGWKKQLDPIYQREAWCIGDIEEEFFDYYVDEFDPVNRKDHLWELVDFMATKGYFLSYRHTPFGHYSQFETPKPFEKGYTHTESMNKSVIHSALITLDENNNSA